MDGQRLGMRHTGQGHLTLPSVSGSPHQLWILWYPRPGHHHRHHLPLTPAEQRIFNQIITSVKVSSIQKYTLEYLYKDHMKIYDKRFIMDSDS